MKHPKLRTWMALAAVLAIVASACGGGGSKKTTKPKGSSACPVDALAQAPGRVTITFWHSMVRANEEALTKLTDQFNRSQSQVTVKLVNQNSYVDTFTKFKAGLTSGDLPDLVQLEDTTTQQMIDTGAVVPAQACIDASRYDTSDYVPSVLARFTVGNTLWPLPFNVSNPVLYYDQNAFTKAGLDPTKPPATLDDLKTDAQALKRAGFPYGFALKLDPWDLEQWEAKASALYVNNDNGRHGRATKALFGNGVGKTVFSWMADMVHSGLATTNPAAGPSQFDNLLGIGSGRAAMTIDTSAALGTISQVLGSGQYPNVKLGVAPMPGPPGNGGVLVGGGILYLSKRSSPEKIAAAWKFAQYLDQPDNQATWAAATGYIPIRKSSAKLDAIKNLWATSPGYKVAYDQLVTAPGGDAAEGPVIGDYQGVRNAIQNAQEAMLTNGVAPDQALAHAVASADKAMAEYNARVG